MPEIRHITPSDTIEVSGNYRRIRISDILSAANDIAEAASVRNDAPVSLDDAAKIIHESYEVVSWNDAGEKGYKEPARKIANVIDASLIVITNSEEFNNKITKVIEDKMTNVENQMIERVLKGIAIRLQGGADV
jgi:hypothetical protein